MASRVDLGNLAHVNLDILIQRRECHFNLLKPGFVIEPEEPVDLLAVTAKPPRQLRPRDPFPSQRVRQLPKQAGCNFKRLDPVPPRLPRIPAWVSARLRNRASAMEHDDTPKPCPAQD